MPDYADSRREQVLTLRQETFSGGVHDFVPKHLIPENAAALLQNVEFQVHGTVRRRGGLRVHQELQASGVTQPILMKSHVLRNHQPFTVSIYNSDVNTGVVVIDDNKVGVLSMGGFPAFDERVDVVRILDRIYILQPGNTPLYWQDGATNLVQEFATPGLSLSTMPPVGTATYFQGQAWAGGDLAKPDLVYFTSRLGELGDGESETGQIFLWDQTFQAWRMVTGRVEAIVPFRNQALLIFTDRGVESLEPNANDLLNPYRLTLSPTIGCISKHTIQVTGQDLYFMDHEGHIRTMSQTELDESHGVTNAPLSLRIANVIALQNKRWLKRSRSAFSQGVYWIAMPMGGYSYPNEMWGYSVRDQAWIGPYRFAYDEDDEAHLVPLVIGGMASHRFDGDQERLYLLLKDSAGRITIDIGLDVADFTDRGVTIPVRIESRGYALAPETNKTFVHFEHELRFIHSGGDASVAIANEVRVEEDDWATAGTETFAPDAGPHLPAAMPMSMNPYGKLVQKQSLTSLARGRGLQMRATIKDAACRWELLTQTVTANIDDQEYA